MRIAWLAVGLGGLAYVCSLASGLYDTSVCARNVPPDAPGDPPYTMSRQLLPPHYGCTWLYRSEPFTMAQVNGLSVFASLVAVGLVALGLWLLVSARRSPTFVG